MIIESLELLNFRNYERECFIFDENTNVLYGDNAQGKTNVLEAIYFCSTSRSHRGSKDKKMIRFDMPEAHLRMNLLKGSIHHKEEKQSQRNRSRWRSHQKDRRSAWHLQCGIFFAGRSGDHRAGTRCQKAFYRYGTLSVRSDVFVSFDKI